MKYLIALCLIMSLMLFTACSGEKSGTKEDKKTETVQTQQEEPAVTEEAVIKSVGQILENLDKEEDSVKKGEMITNALASIEEGLTVSPESKTLIQYKLYLLPEAGQEEEAMTLVNSLLAKSEKPERGLLNSKHDILIKMKKYEEALLVAMEIEQGEERKSPWRCMTIVEDYLLLNKTTEATEWLQKAVDRGFIALSYLEEQAFDPLRDSDAFKQMKKTIESNIGINEPAKDFTITLTDGETFQLSQNKEKVILIDFWATWCAPCRAEMPNLKKIYAANKDKGFEIMGISLDSSEGALQDYVKAQEITWKISFSGDAWGDATAKMYQVNSIPSVWLVDKKGVLRYFDIHGEKIGEAVEQLLAE